MELTESNNDTDYNIVAGIVAEMRRLGSYLYLDDFGTGYSNLERLLGLNFNVVKFDRSLLLMTDDEKQRVMLHICHWHSINLATNSCMKAWKRKTRSCCV